MPDDARVASAETPAGPDDAVPAVPARPVTRRGDLWLLGRHRLVCGDARDEGDYAALLGNESADLVFTDPPYNVVIDGNVCGSGSVKHAKFAMASGEMSAAAFTAFLSETLGAMARRRSRSSAWTGATWARC